MESNRNQQIKIIKKSFLSGLLFAIGMAAFDYFDNRIFKIWKFLFHLAFFGIVMGFINRNKLKKSQDAEQE